MVELTALVLETVPSSGLVELGGLTVGRQHTNGSHDDRQNVQLQLVCSDPPAGIKSTQNDERFRELVSEADLCNEQWRSRDVIIGHRQFSCNNF